MTLISRISSSAPWEPVVAYSRLVRAGDYVAVSGTTATDENGLVVGAGQMYVQARQALTNIRTALERAGVSLHDVIRTRMFVTDIGRYAEAARAHREVFADFPPATSMVEVRRLIHPDMLIEIEADAYASTANSDGRTKPKAASKAKASRQVNKSGVKKPAAKKPAAKKSARRK
jgi:enamine deaminase RidA (YjgF/YER057c/UK114 family)